MLLDFGYMISYMWLWDLMSSNNIIFIKKIPYKN